MKRRYLLLLVFIISLMAAGCGLSEDNSAADNLFSKRDVDDAYDESTSAHIQLNGDSASCDSNAVQISGGRITVTDEGTYIVSGTLNDGMLIVNAEKSDKVRIVLMGASIHSQTSAAIYVLQADKVFITLAEDSVNALSNGGTFTAIDENNIDAVIYAKEDLSLNGTGSLEITSPAGHGIVSKDSLRIAGGEYKINCASHALSGKDDVAIKAGYFTLISGKDGIHAENADDENKGFVTILGGSFNISADGDGISAGSSLQIDDGDFQILSGSGSANAEARVSEGWGFMGGGKRRGGMEDFNSGSETASAASDGSSMKGLKAAGELRVSGGSFVINAADDALHSNTALSLSGGTFEIATGDDAFHSDDALTISAGEINITECYEGIEGQHISISGGHIALIADDDGLNAAGGNDSSGFTGGRDGMFGRGMSANSNGSITVSGGTLNITASGDGMDANGTLEISGGSIIVCGPNRGDTATLDYDTSGIISGGTFIGTGASTMAQSFSDAKQGVIAVNAGNQSAGTEIILTDGSGRQIIRHSPALDYTVIILSSPEIISGASYTLSVGSVSETITAV